MEKLKLHSVEEASGILGMSAQYLRRCCRQMTISHTRLGHRYMFSEKDLAKMIVHVEAVKEAVCPTPTLYQAVGGKYQERKGRTAAKKTK